MNKSLIKFITDFGPLVIFFGFYYKSGKNLQVAIPPLIIATIISVFIVWILEKKIPFVPLLGGALITFFGGLTIYFKDPIFIYMKPTIINIIFALALFFGKYFTREPILKFTRTHILCSSSTSLEIIINVQYDIHTGITVSVNIFLLYEQS